MKPEIRVFLLGFALFEKSTFESFFKLAGHRDTGYIILKDIAQAQVVVVNGDNFAAVQWVTKSVKSPQKALFIGAPDPAGKWPVVAKPIKLSAILGLLDMLVSAGKSASSMSSKPRMALNLIGLATTGLLPAGSGAPIKSAF